MCLMKYFLCLLSLFFVFAQAYTPSTFDDLLTRYVTPEGWVSYADWAENEGDVARLQAFVDEMAVYDPSALSGNEELAFWINAYNAFALHEVLERYPVDTIRPAFLGIPERSFFVEKEHVVNGQNYSLDNIENSILRKLDEPRIHFAINCASRSCPVMLNQTYKASQLDEQLTEQAVLFVNDPSRNRFDPSSSAANISKIFDWFEADFESEGGVANYLLQFAKGDALTVLQAPDLEIDYLSYDWSLNSD